MSISTHVLDTMRGTPAAGLDVSLSRREADGGWKLVGRATTDADGRIRELPRGVRREPASPGPAPQGGIPPSTDEELEEGEYRLVFETRPYFERSGLSVFYPEVAVVFSLEDPGSHLHVPLLLSPYGYTTYRGT